jgi:hypothetical protein
MANGNRVAMPWWHLKPNYPGDEPFIQITNPWDIVVIDTFSLPGLSKVRISRGHSIEVKNSAGKHFATMTDHGYKPCDVIITTRIWTPSQWYVWQTLVLPYIEPDPSDKYKLPTVNLFHPAAQARRIQAISIENIEGPTEKERGIYEFTIKGLEFAQSKTNATNTPKNAGVTPFSNALVNKGNKPSKAPIPTKGNRE